MKHRARGAILAVLTGGLLALAPVAAGAFEPPADPADRFSCEGGPVAGHPGTRGQMKALAQGTAGAWNATVVGGGPLAVCA